MKRIIALTTTMLLLCSVLAQAAEKPLPVKVPDLVQRTRDHRRVLTLKQINNIVGPDKEGKGLALDLGDTTLFGDIYTGPYPFEAGQADYDYTRYRRYSQIRKGRGVLRIQDLYRSYYNANNWPAGQGWAMTPTVAYRLDLWRRQQGDVRHLGFYESVVSFKKEGDRIRKVNTIMEGPFVSLINSEDPTTMLLSWTTSEMCRGTVTLVNADQVETKWEEPTARMAHEVEVDGLSPQTRYSYFIQCTSADGEGIVSNRYHFISAPLAGQGTVTVAYGGDGRQGVGGGERTSMGTNTRALKWMAQDAHRRGADLILFGGDLVNGYTTDTEEFELQLTAWKRAVAGFWRFHPIYPGMGNHEALLNSFDNGSRYGLAMDKWPYASDSAEVVFGQMFYNPKNGPQPSDPRRPPYTENVYSTQYGPLFMIAFNNNYWWTSNRQIPEVGGSPEGYIMDDQLTWIEAQLDKAQRNTTVKYILLFAQEPVFPCGGHTDDAMWYHGNNNIRAYALNGKTGQVEPQGPGIIEVRNRLWGAIATHDKVAAVLSADEHEYYRVLVTDKTPVGIFPTDDLDGDGILDQYSPNPDFHHPVYFITAGTAGAPYYGQEKTPWTPDVFTSQIGYVLLKADDQGISLDFITETGQVFDSIPDLMAVKK